MIRKVFFSTFCRLSIRFRTMPDTKLYDLLGVSRNASDQEIKKVFWIWLEVFFKSFVSFFWRLITNSQKHIIQIKMRNQPNRLDIRMNFSLGEFGFSSKKFHLPIKCWVMKINDEFMSKIQSIISIIESIFVFFLLVIMVSKDWKKEVVAAVVEVSDHRSDRFIRKSNRIDF